MIERGGPGSGPRLDRPDRGRPPGRRSGRRRLLVAAVSLLALAVAFWIGLALGKALESAPEPGGTQSIVRTFNVGTAEPATTTVTVTTTP
jgi:hypothetical protein